jgi:putative ABC transport system substrate-binding protein
VSTGLVANLARPGGNVTGLGQLSPELSAKRLALLKEVVPKVSRIALLTDPTNSTNAQQLRDTKAAAKALGVSVQLLEVRRSLDLPRRRAGSRGCTGGRNFPSRGRS